MNALESASLVMIPSGYEDGTLGSLKPTDGTGDFTFSRGSNISATRVNADGNIEKGYENLLLQSNQFDTTWQSIRVSESTGFLGYDGSNDAWKIVPNTQVNDHRLDQSTSVSGVWTFSIYAKAAGYDFLYLLFSGIGNSGKIIDISPNQGVVVDTKGGVQAIDESITDVGNDWWKITLTYSGTLGTLRIITLPANNTSSYAGDGTSGILIQDAMLNQGMVAYPYVETTTAPVAGGILEDMPRLDYSNGSCPSLLLEPSRTNVVPQSEYLTSSQGLATIEYNGGISPEGVSNAIRIVENTSTSFHTLNSSATISNTSPHTLSVFVKTDGVRNTINLRSGVSTNIYTSSVFTLSGSGSYAGSDGGIEDYGNGWYRIYWTFSHTQTGTSTLFFNASYYAGTGQEWFFYGAQLEQDATYPTSYIPTYGVSQTRLAEDINRLDISSLAATYQTLFIEASVFSVSTTQYKFSINDATGYRANRFTILINNDDLLLLVNSQGSAQPSITQNDYISANTTYKIAAVVRDGSYALFANGTKIGEQVGTTPSNLNSLTFGDASNPLNQNWEGNVNQALVFPTALSDEACIELTTI